MGEYALYGGERVKIGTCEDMYYLRADQRHRVMPVQGSLDPTRADVLEVIRFRFPFPDEDRVEPGAFDPYDRTIGLYGIEPPAELEHGKVQFVAGVGYNVCLPCPESAEAKASGLTFHRNGHRGPVQFGQTALRGGRWVLIARCGGCHYPYRYETLEDVQPVLKVLADEALGEPEGSSGRAFYETVAARILAGYGDQAVAL